MKDSISKTESYQGMYIHVLYSSVQFYIGNFLANHHTYGQHVQ